MDIGRPDIQPTVGLAGYQKREKTACYLKMTTLCYDL